MKKHQERKLSISTRNLIIGGLCLALILATWLALLYLPQNKNQADESAAFEDLGIPVKIAGLASYTIGPNKDDSKDLVYIDFSQIGDGNSFFLLAVDPDTGKAQQYRSPLVGNFNAQTVVLGADKRLYMVSGGTSGTPFSGHFVVFDPKTPEKGIQDLGKIPGIPDRGTTVWTLNTSADGKIYGGSGPNAVLVSYDTKTGKMENLGRMGSADATIIRQIAIGANGKVYMGIGYTQSDVVVYDPITKTQKSILPPDKRVAAERGQVFRAIDGEIYLANAPTERPGFQWYKLNTADDSLTPIASNTVPKSPPRVMRDGRQVIMNAENIGINTGSFQVWDPVKRAYNKVTYSYESDGSAIFTLGVGPGQQLYGSSVIPLQLFRTNPSTGSSTVLGNPTESSGEIYSLLEHGGRLYSAAYSHANFSVYDPNRPFRLGTAATDNPRSFGSLAPSQDRPKAMVIGPKNQIYIGTTSVAGSSVGALTIFDPVGQRITESYRTDSMGLGNTAIDALAYDSEHSLLYGGAGSRLFAWSAESKSVVLTIDLPGVSQVQGMSIAQDKLFIAGLSGTNPIITFDLKSRTVAANQPLPFGYTRAQGLMTHSNGYVYGVTGHGVVYRIDPATNAIVGLGQYSKYKRGYGAAVLSDGLYFGNGTSLIRYRLAGRASDPGAITDPSIVPSSETDNQDSLGINNSDSTAVPEALSTGKPASSSTDSQKAATDKKSSSSKTSQSKSNQSSSTKRNTTDKSSDQQTNTTASEKDTANTQQLLSAQCNKSFGFTSFFCNIRQGSQLVGIWTIDIFQFAFSYLTNLSNTIINQLP